MKAKILAFTLALFSAGGVMAQEEDDLYFFTGDRQKVEKGTKIQVATPDQPSKTVQFSSPTPATNNVASANRYANTPLAGSGNVYVTNNYYGSGFNNVGFTNGFYYTPSPWVNVTTYGTWTPVNTWGRNSTFYYGGGYYGGGSTVFTGTSTYGGVNNAWCPPGSYGNSNTNVYANTGGGYYSSGYYGGGSSNTNVWCPPAVRNPQPPRLNTYCPPVGGSYGSTNNNTARRETARNSRSSWNTSNDGRVYAPRSTSSTRSSSGRPSSPAARTSSASVGRSTATTGRSTGSTRTYTPRTTNSGNSRGYTPRSGSSSSSGRSSTYTPRSSSGGSRSSGVRSSGSSGGSRSSGVRSSGGGSRSSGSRSSGGRSSGGRGRGN